MTNTYKDLVHQTFDFPQEGFEVIDNELYFNGVSMMEVIRKYGTPLKLIYLPKISSQIQKAKSYFKKAFQEHKYGGKYFYCYCTKSSHFSYILEEVVRNDVHIETSYAYDINIIRKLYEKKLIDQNKYIICNGFKTRTYTTKIAALINDGFENVIPILDNK